ncbi:hypothetical protein [Plantibacter sp. YIM 135347]|uniref:ORC-CDC6 family AAA ATPase n=1 Tax=Plantibacter sp. YIM 135347 TaxID=3423919 RepID=UPI003D32D6B4
MTREYRSTVGPERPLFAYNAIQMSARQVAQSFVPPAAFETLIRCENAILAGPRGSGKTTLLKMLQSEALEAWAGPDAGQARSLVRASGVFIGVDKMWSAQISLAPSRLADSFGVAAYALHIGRSLTRAMEHKTRPAGGEASENAHLRATLTPDQISAVCRRIARLFKLPYSTPTFAGTTRTFGDRLNELGTFRHRLGSIDDLPDWAFLEPIQAVSEVADEFNEYALTPDHKWTLLFDEMELAPNAIIRDILGGLRGNQDRINFKISLAPILRETDLLVGERGAIHSQDLEYIPLTSAVRGESTAFVKTLIERQLDDVTDERVNIWRMFGESAFDSAEGTGRPAATARTSPYRATSALVRDMRYLQETDSSFSKYLEHAHVDLGNLESMPDSRRAAVIRKIRNLIVVRAYYRRGASRRSRKSYELYAGASSLLSIPDGNPRMATILARRLVLEFQEAKSGRVTPAKQALAIDEVSNRFMALLNAQVGIVIDGRATTMVDLVDRIGKALADRVTFAPFSADAPAGFHVDDSVRSEHLLLLKQAVNTGAIVHMAKRSDEAPVADSPLGRHYRLSYLLAPRYGLPLRVGKTVALRSLLSRSRPERTPIPPTGHSYLEGMDSLS